MAQDFRIMAPDQVRAVTVTNVSQSVALDVNVVSAMFSATLNIAPVVTVTSTLANPVWVTGAINSTFSASVTFPVAISSTFSLSSSQNHDLVIAQGLQGAAVQWNMGVGTGTVLLSVDGVNFSHEAQFDLSSSAFVYGATHNGAFVVPTIAGANTIRMHYEGVGSATGTLLVTYAPFTGHQSGSAIKQITGTVAVQGTASVQGVLSAGSSIAGNAINSLVAMGITTPGAGTTFNGRTTYLRTDLSGSLWTTVIKPATVVFSSASLNNSATTLLASNGLRLGATVSNRSLSFPVYVALGSGASFDSYGARLPPNGYFEVPYGFTGQITAACSGTQTAIVMVQEVTK